MGSYCQQKSFFYVNCLIELSIGVSPFDIMIDIFAYIECQEIILDLIVFNYLPLINKNTIVLPDLSWRFTLNKHTAQMPLCISISSL